MTSERRRQCGTWAARLLCLCVPVLLSACAARQLPDNGGAGGSVSLAELELGLARELAALGIDPARTPAAAPTDSANAVFDLQAVLLDTAGVAVLPGGPVAGVRLTWTEQLIGDYDQNGEVNQSDLKPLGQHFQATVEHAPPAQHGGFAAWPAGDPAGAGAFNWRLSRIDGDANGELNLADIKPIAQHYNDQLNGYRVYRQAPGEIGFTCLPNLLAPPYSATLPHGAAEADKPLRYDFTDLAASPGGLGAGIYRFYVAGYDAASGGEAPASAVVQVDILTGVVNRLPSAMLAIDPGTGVDPQVVRLDAGQSLDTDGAVAAYRWDFEGDGSWDLTTGPDEAAVSHVYPQPGAV